MSEIESEIEEAFEINLCNSNLAFMIGVPAMLVLIVSTVYCLEFKFGVVLSIIVIAGGGYGGFSLLKKLVIHRAIVSVFSDHLIVRHLNTDSIVIIPFSDVLNYKYSLQRDREELLFTLVSGRAKVKKKVKISSNTLFGSIGDFSGLVRAIEQAASRYHQQYPTAMVRGKSFFEKRIATVLLVVTPVMFILAVIKMVHDNRPVQGDMLIAVGAYTTYSGLWYAARKRRNEA